MSSERLTPEQLHDMADDAFVVLNWAKRSGFNRERQVIELVRTFEVRLGYRAPNVGAAPEIAGMPVDEALDAALGAVAQ
ncbi:hypothetical protein [Mesorhizobium sp.]|uniref:hypothetical protein n=1 Tax=Mesorhizobium sp. TaxID=1871066 RepID=UPI0025E859A1|nr:hypothetical protein [Mesorhizobium sp.]